jgi:hypothetical protein
MRGKRRKTELASPFLVSIADLFLGASATLLCIIVVTAAPQNPKIPRVVDHLLECRLSAEGQWLVAVFPIAPPDDSGSESADGGTAFKPPSRWLADLKANTLLLRIGVLIRPNEVSCFTELEKSTAAHNRVLSARGTVSPAVALVLIPSGQP